MTETAIITHGGAVRCGRGCKGLLYVVPAFQHGIAFIAEISSNEAHEIRAKGMSLLATLDYLGARFPEAA